MTKVSMTQDLGVSADDLWKVIGGFNALPDWHPAVANSELENEGQDRRLSLADGATLLEKLVQLDDDAHTYSYTIEESPLPVRDYTATIKVHERDAGCTLQWSSEFQADGAPESDAVAIVQGIYQGGFDSLKRMFGDS